MNKGNNFPKSGPYFMAGTEQTGKYRVIAITKLGKVGYRELNGACDNNYVRIRVEPADEKAAAKMSQSFSRDKWKQPGQNDQFRYSIVVTENDAGEFIGTALKAIGAIKKTAVTKAIQGLRTAGIQVNPNAPGWAHGLLLNTEV